MIRPWYCSRLFWLGLPGLLFLLWGGAGGWIPSQMIQAPEIRLTCGLQQGRVRLGWERHAAGSGGFTLVGRRGTRAPDKIDLFPPAIERSAVDFGGGSSFRAISIACWFLLGLYLVLWAGGIGLRKRQIRRAQQRDSFSMDP